MIDEKEAGSMKSDALGPNGYDERDQNVNGVSRIFSGF